MKVLWIVNFPMIDVCSEYRLKMPISGTWLEAQKREISNQSCIDLVIVCLSRRGINRIRSFEKNLVRFYYVETKTKMEDMPSKELISSINSIINENQPDIIHIHGTELSTALAISKDNSQKIPVCLSIQGLISSVSRKGYYYAGIDLKRAGFLTSVPMVIQHRKACKRASQEEEIIKRFGYFLGRTEWDRAHLYARNPRAKYYYSSELIRQEIINHNKWNIDRIERHSIFFAGGARVPWKGFHTFLRAVKLLINDYPDLKVYVPGEIPQTRIPLFGNIGYGRYIEKIINEHQLSKHIFFEGALSGKDMGDYFEKCNCYVLSSSIENSSNTLLEAMVVGAPIIAADVGGTNDFVTHHQEGLIYRYEEAELLAFYIKKIFENPELSCKLSAMAQKRYTSINSRASDNLIKIYNQVISDFHSEF